jgi:hypothetical protein
MLNIPLLINLYKHCLALPLHQMAYGSRNPPTHQFTFAHPLSFFVCCSNITIMFLMVSAPSPLHIVVRTPVGQESSMPLHLRHAGCFTTFEYTKSGTVCKVLADIQVRASDVRKSQAGGFIEVGKLGKLLARHCVYYVKKSGNVFDEAYQEYRTLYLVGDEVTLAAHKIFGIFGAVQCPGILRADMGWDRDAIQDMLGCFMPLQVIGFHKIPNKATSNA